MLTGELTFEIRILHPLGRSIRGIAQQRQVSRETVRRYSRAPEPKPVYGPPAPRPSKLDPFKHFLKMWIAEAAPRPLPATVYPRELPEHGYEGEISPKL